jgi:hypothetical protein
MKDYAQFAVCWSDDLNFSIMEFSSMKSRATLVKNVIGGYILNMESLNESISPPHPDGEEGEWPYMEIFRQDVANKNYVVDYWYDRIIKASSPHNGEYVNSYKQKGNKWQIRIH